MKPVLNKTLKRHLYDQVKRLDLKEFISRVSGMSFSRSGGSFNGICPMPSHKDRAPSFFVTKKDEGIWVYDCFGCGSMGTIIDFVKDFYSLDHPEEALVTIIEKSGMETGQDALVAAIREARVGCDNSKRLECSHLVASKNCLRLLRAFRNDPSVEKWVGNAYKNRMNRMLDHADIRGIEIVGNEAIEKLVEMGQLSRQKGQTA
jgi:hypothetical protein